MQSVPIYAASAAVTDKGPPSAPRIGERTAGPCLFPALAAAGLLELALFDLEDHSQQSCQNTRALNDNNLHPGILSFHPGLVPQPGKNDHRQYCRRKDHRQLAVKAQAEQESGRKSKHKPSTLSAAAAAPSSVVFHRQHLLF